METSTSANQKTSNNHVLWYLDPFHIEQTIFLRLASHPCSTLSIPAFTFTVCKVSDTKRSPGKAGKSWHLSMGIHHLMHVMKPWHVFTGKYKTTANKISKERKPDSLWITLASTMPWSSGSYYLDMNQLQNYRQQRNLRLGKHALASVKGTPLVANEKQPNEEYEICPNVSQYTIVSNGRCLNETTKVDHRTLLHTRVVNQLNFIKNRHIPNISNIPNIHQKWSFRVPGFLHKVSDLAPTPTKLS